MPVEVSMRIRIILRNRSFLHYVHDDIRGTGACRVGRPLGAQRKGVKVSLPSVLTRLQSARDSTLNVHLLSAILCSSEHSQ